MKKSWLVQRLLRPFKGPPDILTKVANTFAFGCGGNGRLSNKAMELLAPIFRFDYMGAAEFEFGAVPEALGSIVEAAKEDKLGRIVFHPRPEDPSVYILGRLVQLEEIQERIRGWAKGRDENRNLKESTGLYRTLNFIRGLAKEEHWDVVGWLELDNGFFFTTELEMFQAFAALFLPRPEERADQTK